MNNETEIMARLLERYAPAAVSAAKQQFLTERGKNAWRSGMANDPQRTHETLVAYLSPSAS